HVQGEAFLGAVGPDEMRGQALHRAVHRARLIAHAGALDLDDARAELGELARADRAGNPLPQRHYRDAVQRPSHVNLTVRPASGRPSIFVLQVSPAFTGCASVSVPVDTISSACSWSKSGCSASSSTRCASENRGLSSTVA